MDHRLNDDLALVLKRLEIGLQSQVVMDWLDILGQDLAALGNVEVGTGVKVFAHVSSMGAVPDEAGEGSGRETGGGAGGGGRSGSGREVGGGNVAPVRGSSRTTAATIQARLR